MGTLYSYTLTPLEQIGHLPEYLEMSDHLAAKTAHSVDHFAVGGGP